jgi:DNA primase
VKAVSYALDFPTIKASVTIEQVLSMLDISHLTARGDKLRGACPLCKAGTQRDFVVTPAVGLWYCWHEKKGGDCIELVSRHLGLKQKEAAGRIAQHFNLEGAGTADANASPSPKQEGSRKATGFDPLEYQQSLDPDHDALVYSGGAVRALGGGYASKGLLRGKLALPICDQDGTISAFVGIAPDGKDDEPIFHKGYVPPFFMGMEHINEGTLYLVHHPKDMVSAFEGGVENVLALLQPITRETLICLLAVMKDKKCSELEIFA